jgi:hypothetical protein
MNIREIVACSAGLILASCSPNSDHLTSALQPCAGLSEESARLECYDQLALESGFSIPEDPTANFEEKIIQLTEIAQELDLPVPRVIGSDNAVLAEAVLEAAAMYDMDLPTITYPLSEPEIDSLISVASDLFGAYDRAIFSELVLAITPRKTGVELSVQLNDVGSIGELDGGSFMIPQNVETSYSMHGAHVEDGKITMTWKNDFSELDGVTYTLQLDGVDKPLSWTEGGTCLALNLC